MFHLHFDSVSDDVFQVGKLNVYRNADPIELAGLHPSDRLMVQLIKINRLGPRIEGMLYKVNFDETWALLDDVSLNIYNLFTGQPGSDIYSRVPKNSHKLVAIYLMPSTSKNCSLCVSPFQGWKISQLNLHAQLILLIGNYMNGTGIKGGAFGFRVSSINKVSLKRTKIYQ